MVKSIAKQDINTKPYPKLMTSGAGGSIILFTSPKEGTIVGRNNNCEYPNNKPIGYHTTDWIPSNFEDFNGTVELTNNI